MGGSSAQADADPLANGCRPCTSIRFTVGAISIRNGSRLWTENLYLMSVTIWRLVDGTRGHENQSLGLSRAMARLSGARCYDIPAHRMRVLDFLRGRFPAGKRLPDPHLILGAGHATHP